MPDIPQAKLLTEAAALEQQRRARVYGAVGKWLLWMDLLLLIFVYTGLRGGSYMWLIWVLVEAVAGLALIGIGSSKHRRAAQILLALSHVRGQQDQDIDSEEQPERRAS